MRCMAMSRSGCVNGNGRKSACETALESAVVAPMPSVRQRMPQITTAGVRHRRRWADEIADSNVSIIGRLRGSRGLETAGCVGLMHYLCSTHTYHAIPPLFGDAKPTVHAPW